MFKNPRLTAALAALVLALAALALWQNRRTAAPAGGEAAQGTDAKAAALSHPYLALTPEDVGQVSPAKPPSGMLPVVVFNMWGAMSLDFERILFLDECPMRRTGFAWNFHRRALVFSPLDAKWTYEKFDAIFRAVPGENLSDEDRENLYLKASLVPSDLGDPALRRFEGNGLRGFMVDPAEPPVNSRKGHVTSYYLFPVDGEPGMKVDVSEQRDTFERTDSWVHLNIAAMIYPAPKGGVDERMKEAIHASREENYMDAMLNFHAARCAYPREALGQMALMAMYLKRKEILRDALRAADEQNLTVDLRDVLMRSLAEMDGGSPPPVQ